MDSNPTVGPILSLYIISSKDVGSNSNIKTISSLSKQLYLFSQGDKAITAISLSQPYLMTYTDALSDIFETRQ